MTDDLESRLRDKWQHSESVCYEAADYIESLELEGKKDAARIAELSTTLRDVVDSWDWWQVDAYNRCRSVPSEAMWKARKILETNK